jgi:hypothetical protein
MPRNGTSVIDAVAYRKPHAELCRSASVAALSEMSSPPVLMNTRGVTLQTDAWRLTALVIEQALVGDLDDDMLQDEDEYEDEDEDEGEAGQEVDGHHQEAGAGASKLPPSSSSSAAAAAAGREDSTGSEWVEGAPATHGHSAAPSTGSRGMCGKGSNADDSLLAAAAGMSQAQRRQKLSALQRLQDAA